MIVFGVNVCCEIVTSFEEYYKWTKIVQRCVFPEYSIVIHISVCPKHLSILHYLRRNPNCLSSAIDGIEQNVIIFGCMAS